MDDKEARAIGGPRNNEGILDLVPDLEAFRQTLRFIKHWAKCRGISSNALGIILFDLFVRTHPVNFFGVKLKNGLAAGQKITCKW